jgi:hypothetical protein
MAPETPAAIGIVLSVVGAGKMVYSSEVVPGRREVAVVPEES